MVSKALKAFIFTFLIICQSQCSVPRIPSYLGKGYDIVMGNPLSNIIDPGFRYQVIVFEYNQNTYTEDYSFQIPVGISGYKSQSCSLTSDVTEYRGTSSYQNDLKTKVTIEASYESIATKAAFSGSYGYQSMHNKTQSEQTVVYQAVAECQSYKLAIDKYKPYNLTQNFLTAAEISYNTDDWRNFISLYGTHYVTEVLFGGRAIQQTQFTRTNVVELKSKGIDIETYLSGEYIGFSAKASSSTSISDSSRQEVQNSKKSVSNYYIGGHSPESEKLVDWQARVNQEPMPINYKISMLSDLFVRFPNKTDEWISKVSESFEKGIVNYCDGRCIEPTPDKPLPTKTVEKYSGTSKLYGGNGGSTFSWNQDQPNWQILKIITRSGKYLDAIQVQAVNLVGQAINSPLFGGSGGSLRQYSIVSKNQSFSQIEVRSGKRVDALKFYKSNGDSSQRFGGSGGSSVMVDVPQGYKWTGIVGKSGRLVDKIGFIFTKTVYKQSQNLQTANP